MIADYLKTLRPGYPRTLDELIAKASDPKTGYRSPEKLVGLKYTASVALDLNDPVYLAAKTQGLMALIIVPAGMTKDGLPVTLSFLGQPYSEPKLLGYAHDFEQATRARVLPKNSPALPGDTIPQ
jgi:amidase